MKVGCWDEIRHHRRKHKETWDNGSRHGEFADVVKKPTGFSVTHMADRDLRIAQKLKNG